MLETDQFKTDPHQLAAAHELDRLWHQLQHSPQTSFWKRLKNDPPPPVKGLYLWGGVGRGKTWLMDLFFDSLPNSRKQRIHFHRFMQRIHNSLNQLEKVQDPLVEIAQLWAKDCRVLCLDEFFVTDIADAMLLAGLLENLIAQGVTLIATSNIEPDLLYKDGLQRSKFLPAIELLKENTKVFQLIGDQDFRLRILEQSSIYHSPLDDAAHQSLVDSFQQMAAACILEPLLMVNDRPFQAIQRGDGLIWFEFEELCEKPTGSRDFIEIARAFNTVMLSNVPQLTEEDSNSSRRFVTLVDEFYDRGVKLLLSAEVPITSLYTGKRLAFEFERTRSRLIEMQSREYLSRPHLA